MAEERIVLLLGDDKQITVKGEIMGYHGLSLNAEPTEVVDGIAVKCYGVGEVKDVGADEDTKDKGYYIVKQARGESEMKYSDMYESYDDAVAAFDATTDAEVDTTVILLYDYGKEGGYDIIYQKLVFKKFYSYHLDRDQVEYLDDNDLREEFCDKVLERLRAKTATIMLSKRGLVKVYPDEEDDVVITDGAVERAVYLAYRELL